MGNEKKRWLRRVVVALACVVPLRRRTSWQWYRRAYGGRWSRNITGERWHPVKCCLGAFHSDILGGEGVPVGVCFDERESKLAAVSAMGDEVSYQSDAHECFCEVWP